MAERKKLDVKMIGLSFLMMIDYILTWMGIRVDFIVEGNPFMKWLFELNFVQGFIVRFLIIFAIISLAHIIKRNSVKIYKNFAKFAIGINILVLGLHCRWILDFLQLYSNIFS